MGRPSFPRSLIEFQRRFSGDEECRRYLLEARWPDGYCCPRCNHGEFYELSSRSPLLIRFVQQTPTCCDYRPWFATSRAPRMRR